MIWLFNISRSSGFFLWNGKPVRGPASAYRPNATLTFDGETVGFCSPGHRDQFTTALTHFSSPGSDDSQVATVTDAMAPMESVADTTYVPPLVDELVLAQFCQAVQSYATGQGLSDAVTKKLISLQLRLNALRNLASLARLTLIGYTPSFGQLEGELRCLVAEFACEKPEPIEPIEACYENASLEIVLLSAAVDLFAAAAFLWRNDRTYRDRAILAIVRAIEEAVAFPASFAAEAASYIGMGTGELAPAYAALAIATATRRLLASGDVCVHSVPADVRQRLKGLALAWIEANPVTAFLEAIEGPVICRIVRWQAQQGEARVPLRAGDTLSVLVHEACDLMHMLCCLPRFNPRRMRSKSMADFRFVCHCWHKVAP